MSKQIKLLISSNIGFKNAGLISLLIGFIAIFGQSCQKKVVVLNGCAIQPNTVCLDTNLDFLDLEGANLKGANLSGSSFWGTNLKGANLEGAILSDVTIGNAHTNRGKIDAILEKTNFKNSFINSSRIEGQGVEKANFKGAVMCQVRLSGGNNDHSGCDNSKKFKTLHEIREYGFE